MIRSQKQRQQRTRMWTLSVLAVIAVPVVIGLCLLGTSGAQGNGAALPSPSSPTATPSATNTPTAAAADTLPRSKPVQLAIPAIGVRSGLQQLALNPDKKTIQLPKNPRKAGWYGQSATPGEPGLTVILGYITSHKTPGVFHRLGALKVAEKIALRRADGKAVTYSVDKIASYARNKLPAKVVYAASAKPALRIITCGGTLHRGQAAGNVVVFAHKVAATS